MAEAGVTVVVPTLDRGGFLADCLRDLLAQDHRPLEILVVDQSDSVSQEVRRLVEENPRLVSHCHVGFRGLPKARNFGWQRARHEAIVFVDDDIRCEPHLVAEHVRALSMPGVGAVAGGIDEANKPRDSGPPTGTFSRWTATASSGFAAEEEMDVDHAKGCNFSVLREAIRAAGGFDERLGTGAALYEELEFCLRLTRAGWRVRFSGSARLTHLAAPEGGCRVAEVPAYVRSLAHNRGMLIRRHLRWSRMPVAAARLALTGAAFARHYRAPAALVACGLGFLEGMRDGGRRPLVTRFA